MTNELNQPAAIEIEDALIGAVLLESFVIPSITKYLKPECFYSPDNRLIFEVCLKLFNENKPVDILTVCQEIKNLNKLESIGGAYKVSSKTNRVASSANSESHAAIIYQKYVLREVIRIGKKYQILANEPNADSFDVIQEMSKELRDVEFISKNQVRHVGDVALEIIETAKKINESGGVRPGIHTGHRSVDQYFSKQKQDLGIIAARPGMGKTAYMLSLAKNTAMVQGKPVLIFSLEMSTSKLVGRLMASESGVSSKLINENHLDSGQILALGGSLSKLVDAPIYVDDSGGLDVISLRSKIRRFKQLYGISEVYIDYLQLMAGERKGNREQEISFISRNMKLIAKDEDLPITALCQLSRNVESRPDKKPQLSDLRESGAIEQDADWVMFLMRPEYYGMGEDTGGVYQGQTFNGRYLESSGLLILDCAKYREGGLFTSALLFSGEYMQISDYGY